MLGVFGKIFGAPKVMGQIVEQAAKGFDKLKFTEEEKSDADRASKREAQHQIVEYMKATQGQNVARRLLALLVVGTWLFMFVVGALMGVIGAFYATKAASFASAADYS